MTQRRRFELAERAGVWLVLSFSALLSVDSAYGQFWPSSYERSAAALTSEDVETRRGAARDLSRMPSSVARQLLSRALRDRDPEVRLLAGAVVLEHAFEEAAPVALQWLSDTDPRVRALAAQVLARLGPSQEAIAPLARVLSDPSPVARKNAARALARARSVDAARVLLNHLDDANEEFQLEVIDALAALGEEAAVLPLIAKVQDGRAKVRRRAIRALSGLAGADRASGALLLALSDSDPEVRVAAIRALGEIGATDAVDALEEVLLRDREIPVRVAALNALVSLSSPRAFRLAIQMLDHPRHELRSEALARLSETGEHAQTELTRCVAGDGLVADIDGCALALGRSRTAGAASIVTNAYREGKLSPVATLRALAATEDASALPIALEMLDSDSSTVRQAALRALWQLLHPLRPDGRAVEPLAEALRDAPAPEEAALLLPLLGRTGSPRAVPHLESYLHSDAPVALRVAATRGLGWIKRADVQPRHMIAGLTADRSELRWETAMAVREGEWQGVAQPLVALLERAGQSEMYGLGTAFWGPAVNVRHPVLVKRVQTLIENAPGREQDVLLEAFARIHWKLTSRVFASWVRDSHPGDDAKLAEVLAQQPGAKGLLVAMLDSQRNDVLASAVWGVGRRRATEALPRVRELLRHTDVSVAANAVATFARLSEAEGATQLCALLDEKRAPMLANALAGLRLMKARCDAGGRERQLLSLHPSSMVRERAAALIAEVPSSEEPKEDERALRQCGRHEIDGGVAARCLAETPDASTDSRSNAPLTPTSISVLVVPASGTNPKHGVPFALEVGGAFVRFGWADRRGGVYEVETQANELRLLLPAGLW